ncbi:hypothetical protein CDL12_11280 [Handroanthus impetiginosus]|uniref:Uncharacterized protein n=1 Tax=Handroanthus impetiginosus TaxID=429701 RepID=A0A2G9HEX5_9LAMI|nr:hypothetical protein CDL12_11280 [Handroanthus impetiginosus]
MESRYSLLEEGLFSELPSLHSEIESKCTSGENLNLLENCLAGTNQPSPIPADSNHDSIDGKERENDQIEKTKNTGSPSQVIEKRNNEGQRQRGVPWTKAEHWRFLIGLDKFGRGDWKSISMHCVGTKTPTQVASHAQKYFERETNQILLHRRRRSIHDIRTVNPTTAFTPSLPQMGHGDPNLSGTPTVYQIFNGEIHVHQNPDFNLPMNPIAHA